MLGADGGLGCRYLSEVRKLTADVSIEVGTLGRCSHELVVDRLRYAEILVDGAAPKLQRQLSGDWIVSGGGKRGGLDRQHSGFKRWLRIAVGEREWEREERLKRQQRPPADAEQ